MPNTDLEITKILAGTEDDIYNNFAEIKNKYTDLVISILGEKDYQNSFPNLNKVFELSLHGLVVLNPEKANSNYQYPDNLEQIFQNTVDQAIKDIEDNYVKAGGLSSDQE